MLGECSPFLTSTGDHVILKGVWSDQLSLATLGNEVTNIYSFMYWNFISSVRNVWLGFPPKEIN